MREVYARDLLDSPFIKKIGRYWYDDVNRALWFNFSAAGFRIKFRGSKLVARFLATKSDDEKNRPYLSVFMKDENNSQKATVVELKEKKTAVEFFNGKDEIHEITILKRNESITSQVALYSLWCDGEFLLEEEKENKIKIEYYGNSVTAGNGTAAEEGDQIFMTKTEDACLSFAYLSAQLLNAEHSLICVGGFPVYKSPWVDWCKIKSIIPMVEMADFDENTTIENAHYWDNSAFIPDLVVFNLAANDSHHFDKIKDNSSYKDELKKFKDAYCVLIDKIFMHYPKTKIVITSGMIKVREDIELILDETASEYENTYRFKFTSLSVGGYMPNEGHPNAKMHEHAAKELVAFIREKSLI